MAGCADQASSRDRARAENLDMAAAKDATVDVERLGMHWRVDPQSCIGRSVIEHGAWEPATTKALLAAVRPGMRVLDVGANFGWFTLLLAHRVGQDGHVWAFEPVSGYRRTLRHHLIANGLDHRVTVVPYGLSDATAERPIVIGESSATMHWAGGEVPRGREIVQLRALDDVAEALGIDRVDLVKLDLDGHEPRFLRGACRTLARWRPLLSLEFAQHCLHEDGSDVRQQLALLHALDYEACSETSGLPFGSDAEFLQQCGNFDRSANVLARPVEQLAGMPIRLHRDLAAMQAELGLSTPGAILEDDIDTPENDCELFARKRRDAEVLCTLAASNPGPCLDLGTSFGRSAFKLATNVGAAHRVYTVNMLPEHAATAGVQITHVLQRHQVGSYCREHGVDNVVQIFADLGSWQPDAAVRDLALAFVDACHDADAVCRDSLLAWQRLRPGGHLVWHDFSPTQRHRHGWIDSVMTGVTAFLRAIGHRGPVQHLRGSWTGFLRKAAL